jgi:serine/threonine protein kinase/tetratricopeptide (TPR) repeat protein
MTLAALTRLGPYEIVAQLGAGGMGEVYRARDTRLDRDVAVKVLPERVAEDHLALARFQREAKAIAALSHPNILAIYDIGTEQGTAYAVMELLQGETLGRRIKNARLDWRSAVNIGLGIAEGLAAAHAKGIIHRDIKPDNIFLTIDGGVKVLDFGLARLEPRPTTTTLPDKPETITLETQPGMVMGTVAYMSPEQVRGQPADARSDIFAFGCVLYEMVSGKRPFDGGTNADMMAAILQQTPAALTDSASDRPAELDRVIVRCLEKNPAHRFQTARELAQALRNLGVQAGKGDTGKQAGIDTGKHAETAPAKTIQTASVAVLPFVNMSSDAENEYFSDGLAEELIAALTKVEGLHVASRTSAFAFKGKNEDVRKIGEQLNVRTVLEGSVRKAGNRLRISAQLVNAADGCNLWSETFNRQLEDVFAIQDEIAQNIVKALRVILTEKDKRAMEQTAPTADVEAYDYYLRGRQFFRQFRRKGFEFARQMFARAIAIDPCYARAYAGMADCHSFLYQQWEATEANVTQADACSRKALELGADLAETHVARGFALSLQKRFEEACKEFETAIGLDPTLYEARYFYGRTRLAEGKLEEAARLFEEACRMRPDEYQAASHLTSIYAGLGRKAECQAACRRCLQVVEKHLQLHPDDARALYLGAVVWGQLGERAKALDWAGRALALDPEEPITLYNVACMYSLQGEPEQAMDCLEKAVRFGFAHKAWIENDADFNAVREHARYKELLKKM